MIRFPQGITFYVLQRILHDWPDREAKLILTRCAEAARPSGRVVIVSGIVPDEMPPPELLMMMLVGGKERTLDEFRELARESGLEIRAAGRQLSGRFIVECQPRLIS